MGFLKPRLRDVVFLLVIIVILFANPATVQSTQAQEQKMISLPKPILQSTVSLEAAFTARKSTRRYSKQPIDIDLVAQLLWAAQGIDATTGRRTVPSAGALYPLELYLVAKNVRTLTPGVYHYRPGDHALEMAVEGDLSNALTAAALGQTPVGDGAACLVIAAVYERTAIKYDARATRYVHIEVGHASQNIYLQAAALGLGTVAIGAFYDEQVKKILGMKENELPLCIMPVGRID